MNAPLLLDRRAFLGRSACGIGGIALHSLLAEGMAMAARGEEVRPEMFQPIAPKAKRVIFLFQSGGPSHMDLFDGKDSLDKLHGSNLPDSVRAGQRVTGMTSGQSSFPVLKPISPGKRCGPSGVWISDLLPWTQKIAGEICVMRSMHTEAINHDPAITLANTGSMQLGHASAGAWVSYGLGSENKNFPAFMVLISQGTGKNPDQPIFSRLWGSGYLPSQHQGVILGAGKEPVLYLDNPDGVTREQRRATLDDLAVLNTRFGEQAADTETMARIQQYEMAFRMQASVPELTDLSGESQETLDLYGPEVRKPGTYAANCLLARRLAERGVRFIQLFHRGWDQHVAITRQLPNQCRDTDQPSAALVMDLKRRGLLEDTLVIWGGEFGRTVYSQGQLGSASSGRDHHGRCFSLWMAGAGVKAGYAHGETDDFCWNITKDPVHLRDLHATMLERLGIDHNKLVFPYRGLDQKLTGVEPAKVVTEVLT
ncbi:DUF1501 domain-containing protein [Haloferula sp. BvORR071]|uniref:DUF1501 domain-containing protein n=1 Tax=Haloferula sp. BvORR071 TaxID=1396141 RepID=UPI0005530A43|nr:DUF1501 domain-containing protein [Haloferula sp. BvORR071]